VIIDSAQLLDEPALDMLIRLRSLQRTPSGIALCVTLEKNEKLSNALERLERKLPYGSRALFHRRNALALPRLAAKEFVGTVVKAMFEQLELHTSAETPTEQNRKGLIGRGHGNAPRATG